MHVPTDLVDRQLPSRRRPLIFIAKAVGFAAGAGLIAWFVSRSDITAIGDQLSRIHWRFILLIAATGTAYLLCALAWKLSFLHADRPLSVARLFIIRIIGESLAQVNPTNVIAGDAFKAMILKRHGISYKDGIVSLTVSRFIIMLSAVSLIVAGVYAFFDQLSFQGGALSSVVIVGIFAALLGLLVWLLASGRGIFSSPAALLRRIHGRFPSLKGLAGVSEKLIEVDKELLEFYRTKKINLAAAWLFSLLHWLMGAMEFYIILSLLGLPVTFTACIGIEVGVMVFKALGAFIPGQVGIEEYASKLMLELTGVSGGSVWITVAILRRARQLFWIGVGLAAFLVIIRVRTDTPDGNPVHNA